MKIAELQSRGGFVDQTLIKRHLKWDRVDENGNADPVEFDIFVKRNSFGLIDRTFKSVADERSRSATLIAGGVRLGENGEEEMTYEQAYSLDAALAYTMLNEFMQVNNLRKTKEGEEADPKN